jgi:rubrerythrin
MGIGQEAIGSDSALANDIKTAITLEVHAYNYYERLAELAPNEQDRQIILRIQRDEAKHYQWFSMLLSRMGIQQPQIPPGQLPSSFIEGVGTAIRNELDAQAFYQDIAFRANSMPVQTHFMHAAHDEQRHASWLQYILTQQ